MHRVALLHWLTDPAEHRPAIDEPPTSMRRVCLDILCAIQVIGEGFHPEAGKPHAEVYALRAAGQAAKGATAYVTLEP